MRSIVSPLDGIRSPFPPRASGTADQSAAAAALLGTEDNGFALDFLVNGYALRTLDATDMIGTEPSGLAIEFISNTYAVRQ